MLWIIGEQTGKTRSTPTPDAILRTVKVSVVPIPRRWITTPWNFCNRSLLPSIILIVTETVSPARKSGHSGVSTNLLAISLMRSIIFAFSTPVNWGAILQIILVRSEYFFRNLYLINPVAEILSARRLVAPSIFQWPHGRPTAIFRALPTRYNWQAECKSAERAGRLESCP